MSQTESLQRGLAALGIDLPAAAQTRLLDYLALLLKWNRTHNLTAVRDPDAGVAQHLLDSLAVLPHLPVGALADVGSGGGLPGIPLAIAQPQRPVMLVESNQKKAAFLRQARTELALDNVAVQGERAEAIAAGAACAAVVSRAFSDLPEFVRLAGHLVAPGGALYAMKGVHPYEEIAQLPAGWRVRAVQPLTVPRLQGQRHLVIVERSEA